MDARLRRNLLRVLGVVTALVAFTALTSSQAFAGDTLPPGDEPPPVEPPPPEPPPPPPPPPAPEPPPPAPVLVSPGIGTEAPAKVRIQTICSAREPVLDRPRGVQISTVRRKDRVRLGRRSHRGRWSYVITKRSRGWIRTSAICS